MEREILAKTPKRRTPVWHYNLESEEKAVVIFALSEESRMKHIEAADKGETAPPVEGETFSLNEVASQIWEMCDGTNTIEDMVSSLAQEYEVDPECAYNDVVAFLEQMKDLVDLNWEAF